MTRRRDVLKLSTMAGLAGAAAAASGAGAAAPPAAPAGFVRQRVTNPDKSRGGFPHAIRLRNVSEWMIFAGHSALGSHGEILFPGDALAQLRWIWQSLERTLVQEGWSLADVVQLKMTCVADVPLNERVKFLGVVHDVFGRCDVPPVGAAMSVVHSLAYPGMLVEVDIWAAR